MSYTKTQLLALIKARGRSWDYADGSNENGTGAGANEKNSHYHLDALQEFLSILSMYVPIYETYIEQKKVNEYDFTGDNTINLETFETAESYKIIDIHRIEIDKKHIKRVGITEISNYADSDNLFYAKWGSYLVFNRDLTTGEQNDYLDLYFTRTRKNCDLDTVGSTVMEVTTDEYVLLWKYARFKGTEFYLKCEIGKTISTYVEDDIMKLDVWVNPDRVSIKELVDKTSDEYDDFFNELKKYKERIYDFAR